MRHSPTPPSHSQCALPHPDTSPLPQRPQPRYPPPMQALTNNTNTANQLTRHEATTNELVVHNRRRQSDGSRAPEGIVSPENLACS